MSHPRHSAGPPDCSAAMPGVPQQFECALDRAEFRAPAARPGIELYRAHIVRHAFVAHTHDAYGFGAIEAGVERFSYGGSEHLAACDSLVLMNPDVLHTGRAETASGWRYRMIYLTPEVLDQVSGERGWWFADVVVAGERARARRLSQLLKGLWLADSPLLFDDLLYRLVEELRPHARCAARRARPPARRFAPVIDYMHAHLGERIVLDDLAAVAGLSPFHFLRQFAASLGATPQQMLMARRVYAAKQMLAAGLAPAQVAAAVGLADQSHLNRAFVRRYGVTPARYQRQVRS